ncbi:MAG TPA: AmmeMemoRadiSam system protein B, partial [Thermoanaerobaculia bacterium]|nr:AmmeMemoRadiSam system protein B [Thermoanaerobaculia bacterium]
MAIRQPAVAGLFYPSRPDELERDVRKFLGEAEAGPAVGAVVPHAGYVYSGPVAGAVYARLALPRRVIVLCPNHTALGAPAALDPSDAWRTPLGEVPLARGLADRLLALAPALEKDPEAHRREHSLEVQLPFLQIRRPDVEIVPVSLGEPSLALCREVGQAIATLVSEEGEPPLVLASSDMN